MISNAAPPSVWSFGRFPGGGVVIGMAVNRLQPKQFDQTVLTSCLSLGIQYISHVAAIVSRTPPCRVSMWNCCTSFLVNNTSAGKYLTSLYPSMAFKDSVVVLNEVQSLACLQEVWLLGIFSLNSLYPPVSFSTYVFAGQIPTEMILIGD